MKNKEINALVFLLLGFAVFCLIMYGLVKYIDFSGAKMALALIAFFTYSFLALWIGNKFNNTRNKFFKIFIFVLSTPIAALILLLKLLGPFMIISMGFIMYLFCSISMQVVIIYIINGIKEIPIEMTTFILFSSSSIIAVAFHQNILNFINKYHPAVQKGYLVEQNKKVVDLIKYLFNINNVRFVIYLLYFIFIIVFSIKTLDNRTVLNNEIIDYAVMQAFLVFLAFDNIRINSKEVKILASKLLEKLILVILADNPKDKDLDKGN